MIIKQTIISIFSIFILTLTVEAQQCPKVPQSNIEFIRVIDKIADVNLHTDVNVSTFNDTSNLHNSKIVMGFTLGNISLNTKFTIRFLKVNNKYCAWPETIQVNYSLDPLDVYIPNDFEAGTCKYIEVKNHEYEHVEIYRKTYQEYLLKLKKLLLEKNSLTKPNDAILVQEVKEAEEIFKDDINQLLNKFQSNMTKVLSKRQKSIDTEENYRIIASRCDGWADSL